MFIFSSSIFYSLTNPGFERCQFTLLLLADQTTIHLSSVLSGHVGECQCAVLVVSRRAPFYRGLDGGVAVGRVPLLHLHGEAAERAPLPALLQALLLPLHPAVAHGAAVPVPSLQVRLAELLKPEVLCKC